MLLRLAYLGVTSTFALLRLPPMGDQDKDVEILALRHQITVPERQLGKTRPFLPSDQAFLAALLHRLPLDVLHQLRLLVRPETVLRWHRGPEATIRRPEPASRGAKPYVVTGLTEHCGTALSGDALAPGCEFARPTG